MSADVARRALALLDPTFRFGASDLLDDILKAR